MADETPPRRPGPDTDGQITSSFPADGFRRGSGDLEDSGAEQGLPVSGGVASSDADSWVDQWSQLFDEEQPPGRPAAKEAVETASSSEKSASRRGTQPPTREMPVYTPEQPPVDAQPKRSDRVPGHLEPDANPQSKSKQERPESDAAEILAWQKAQERSKRRAKLRANQRKAQVMQRQRPAADPGIRVEDGSSGRMPLDYPRSPDRQFGTGVGGAGGPYRGGSAGRGPDQRAAPQSGSPRLALIAGGALIAVLAVVAFVTSGFGLGGNDGEDGTAVGVVSGAEATTPGLEVGADVAPRRISELALSTVQLVGLNDDLQPECAGSGVIVRSDGTILTNAHVVRSEGGCQFTSVGVGVTIDSTAPAELLYRADVLAVDDELDLAVLRIAEPLEPEDGQLLPESFPHAPLGDSDTVELGDNVRILGYPVIGGDTITLTTGTVSGFTSQAGIGSRALIKTDATISAGNSGGLAIDPDGRVIGIPTKARASESGPAIDCRALNDTNSDGAVDDLDNCVPVGGFLNGVRPINLALPLLEASATAQPLGPVATGEAERVEFDYGQVVIENPRFSIGQADNQPLSVINTAVAGIAELCFFVDWAGIPVGTEWDGAWFVNGELDPELGYTDERWTIEEDGRNFWLCARGKNSDGLAPGVYEVSFFLEDTLMFVEGIELTEQPVEVVPVTWTNDTEGEICGLAINPFSESGQVGLNELEDGVSIPPGGSRPIDLPLGRIVVEAYNCDGEPVADAFAGLEIKEAATFLIGL